MAAFVLALFLMLILVQLPFAIASALQNGTAVQSRWSGLAASSVLTEGGNVTDADLNSSVLTGQWAAFYGNIGGSVNLSFGSSTFYSWSWSPASGGEVCLSTGSSPDFSALSAVSAASIDANFSLTAPDNATNTFANGTCNVSLNQGSATSSVRALHKGQSTFHTCAVGVGSLAGKDDFLFC